MRSDLESACCEILEKLSNKNFIATKFNEMKDIFEISQRKTFYDEWKSQILITEQLDSRYLNGMVTCS